MPILVELPIDAERKLSERAADLGTDSASLAALLLQDKIRDLDADDLPVPSAEEWKEMMAGISPDAETRFRPFEEFKADMKRKYGI